MVRPLRFVRIIGWNNLVQFPRNKRQIPMQTLFYAYFLEFGVCFLEIVIIKDKPNTKSTNLK